MSIMNSKTISRSGMARITAILIAIGSFGTAFGLAGCTGEAVTTLTDASSVGFEVEYATEDTDASWDAETATTISLADSATGISGNGASVSTASAGITTVTISDAGTYVLSGSMSNGQIVIDADEDDLVRIVLSDTAVTNPAGSAIYEKQSEKTIITLEAGTANTFADGSSYALAEGEDEPDAAIFCEDDLTINGSGSLTVNGNYNNGIASKDDLVIAGGTFDITAVNDAMRGRDSISVCGGDFTIEAGGDGLQSNNDEDVDKGWISIDGGTYDITAKNDGIQSETDLQVTSGNIAVTAGDDGLHAGSSLAVIGGIINISESYEGIEGMFIDVTGGTVGVVSGDDGFNAAGGSDGSSEDGKAEAAASGSAESYYIRIAGGSITVDASGDGIDSNGSLYFDGGTVLVSGPTNNGNGALDYNGVCDITGGQLVIAGSSGMAQSPSDTSSQYSLTVCYAEIQTAGSKASLVDESGNTVLSFSPTKEYQSIIFSSQDLAEGGEYTLMSGDTKLATITLSDIVTRVSDDGSAVTGSMGGPGGMGGEPGGFGKPEGFDGTSRPEGPVRPDDSTVDMDDAAAAVSET